MMTWKATISVFRTRGVHMKAKFIGSLLCVTIAFALTASAQDAPATAKSEDGKAKAAVSDDKAAAKDDSHSPKGTSTNDPDYVIGVDDVVGINVWREAEMSRSMSVRPDGKIALPLIGEIQAEGKTPRQLQAEVSKKLDVLMKNPDVTVFVQEIRSQKFNILGEVARPGMYPLTKPMTVLDAIAVAGGFRDFAKPKKMYILRKGKDGASAKIAVNYNNLIKGADKNVELESRDTIVVP